MASIIRWLIVCLAVTLCLGCASAPPASGGAAAVPGPITAGDTTVIVGQHCCKKQTLPEFLGISALFQAGAGCSSRVHNMLGNYYPGMESTPAVLAISDPANLDSPSPSVAAAADVKAQQDAAPQKVKALNYLAEIGCGGCYPDVEKALLAALDDCTEEVRLAGAEALRKAAGDPCLLCRQNSCCSPAIRKKLKEVGTGIDEKTNCFKETSPRVRRVARLALERCGCPPPEQPLPAEGPSPEDLLAKPTPEAAPDRLLPGPSRQ